MRSTETACDDMGVAISIYGSGAEPKGEQRAGPKGVVMGLQGGAGDPAQAQCGRARGARGRGLKGPRRGEPGTPRDPRDLPGPPSPPASLGTPRDPREPPEPAMVCGGFACSRNALCALNVVYVLVGVLLVAVAGWARGLAGGSSPPLLGGAFAVGVFLLLIAGLGLLGALRHHQVLLFFVSFLGGGTSEGPPAPAAPLRAPRPPGHRRCQFPPGGAPPCPPCAPQLLQHSDQALKILGGVHRWG
ncbi:tetraspanin-31 [Onychostruthus taczanowskii]|uniref:tetraspanin-31 n=1 Tax=Onychostruthus taczanowskii TaxID=356909 RepID=UPI001B80510F|nr:tetraspanin-31 [Onychostruthus taczanowskii]